MTNPPDSSSVEDAVVGVLLADPALAALAPDGVWWDKAGEAVGGETPKRYVVVAFQTHADEPVFGGRGYEDYLLLVKAVMLNASSVDIRAAAYRFDVLLDDPAPFPVEGYVFMTSHREQRIRYTETDAESPAVRWLHRGGLYRVQVAIPT